jgi:hypothetical protein
MRRIDLRIGKQNQNPRVCRGAHSKNFWGGGLQNVSGPTFMVQYPLKPTCPLFYKKLLVYCLKCLYHLLDIYGFEKSVKS